MSTKSGQLVNPHAPFEAALALALKSNVDIALAEDVGAGDITGLLVPDLAWVSASVMVREQAVLCGAPWFQEVMLRCHSEMQIRWHYAEGDLMAPDSVVCQ